MILDIWHENDLLTRKDPVVPDIRLFLSRKGQDAQGCLPHGLVPEGAEPIPEELPILDLTKKSPTFLGRLYAIEGVCLKISHTLLSA